MKKDRKERKENEKGKTEKRCEESQKEHGLREREISERINDRVFVFATDPYSRPKQFS